jgi:hypothetical protein
MKLVRLESDIPVTESQFSNNLAIAVQLDENAKVALKTLSLHFDNPTVTIDDSNDEIEYGIGGEDADNVFVGLTHGTYTIELFRQEMLKKMNAYLQSDDIAKPMELEIGSSWLVDTFINPNTNSVKFDFTYQVADKIQITNNEVIGNLDYSGETFTKETVVDNNTYNGYIQTTQFICEGGWFVSFGIDEETGGQSENVADSEWIYSISQLDAVNDTDLPTLVIKSSVAMMRDSLGNYAYKKGGVMVSTTTPIEKGDLITITKGVNDGTDMFILYNITKEEEGVPTIVYEGDSVTDETPMDISYIKSYPLLKIGNNTGKIAFDTLYYIPSNENEVNNGLYSSKKNVIGERDIYRNINIKAVPRVIDLSFRTRKLSNLLGFTDVVYQKTGVTCEFLAENDMGLSSSMGDFIVEIPELNLNTYDHSYKQKRNIIMVIPSGDLKNSLIAKGYNGFELSYTDIYPTFISLQNKQTTLTYSQLTVRVTSQKQLITMNGIMSCLLLFKDADDV